MQTRERPKIKKKKRKRKRMINNSHKKYPTRFTRFTVLCVCSWDYVFEYRESKIGVELRGKKNKFVKKQKKKWKEFWGEGFDFDKERKHRRVVLVVPVWGPWWISWSTTLDKCWYVGATLVTGPLKWCHLCRTSLVFHLHISSHPTTPTPIIFYCNPQIRF